jgi:hypothetical protein
MKFKLIFDYNLISDKLYLLFIISKYEFKKVAFALEICF